MILIGAAGSGKSTFAARWFPRDTIVSSDELRARAVPTGKKRRTDVFAAVLTRVELRMADGLLTLVDATNTDWMRRAHLIRAARQHHRAVIAVVFALPVDEILLRNQSRREAVPPSMVRKQAEVIERDLDRLDLEGFDSVCICRTQAEVDHTELRLG